MKLDILKIHQMQIIKGTELARMYIEKPFHIYTVDEYMSTIAEYIQWIREDIVIERFVSQSPKDMLIAPQWGLKNYEFTNLLTNHLRKTGNKAGLQNHYGIKKQDTGRRLWYGNTHRGTISPD